MIIPPLPRVRALTPLLLFGVSSLGPAASNPTPAPTDSALKEEVTVRIGEVQILVTDKDGRAIKGLKPEEIEVREAGEKRRIASLEPFINQDYSAVSMPQPTPLEGQSTDADQAPPVVMPPAPVRRIVFLFDAFNSRTQDREKWVESAKGWVDSSMQANDTISIAVIKRNSIDVVLPFTSDKNLVSGVLASSSFLQQTEFYDSILQMRQLMDDLETCQPAHDPTSCSRTAASSYIFEWRQRAEQTFSAMERYSASLGAIPGRKVMMYFGDGVVQDPGSVASNAILATFGTDKINSSSLLVLEQRHLFFQLQQMIRVAAGANVTFFTFDPRPSSRREVATEAESRTMTHERQFIDPYHSIFESTRSTLDEIAQGTGGRSYNGPRLKTTIPQAADAIEGLYTVGFYRDPAAGLEPKIKIKVLRKGVEITFPDKYDPRVRKPITVPVEIAVGRPEPRDEGWIVPVTLQVPMAQIEFRKEDDRYIAQVATYAEAIAPDGTLGGEAFETVELQIDGSQLDDRSTKEFSHTLSLKVKPGAYRVRTRIADSAAKLAADRTIDITLLTEGTVVAGLQKSAAPQESGQKSTSAPPSK